MPVLGLIAALAASAAGTGSSSIDGVWRSPGGNSIMKIAPCGHGPCGTIAWASDKAKKDAKKTTPNLVGTRLLTHLQRHKDGSWQGKLFIPDRNMHVTAKIRRVASNELKVSGCAGFLCKSAVWTAFPGALPTNTAAPASK